MKKTLKQIIGGSKLLFLCRVFSEKNKEALFLLSRLSSGSSDWHKTEPVLRVEAHAFEKGMSIGAVRIGFGKAKATELISHLQRYLDVGGRKQFAVECCSILAKYIDFNKTLGAEMSDVKQAFEEFCRMNDVYPTDFGGIREESVIGVYQTLHEDFAVFSQSRCAVRDFGKEPVNHEQIEVALKLAEKTPSACNRQSWRIHVYEGEKAQKMLHLQGGNRGFTEDIQYAILVCGDMNYYRFYELSQVYVDGGLYAMNLLYALHYCGLATIPLTMSAQIGRLKKMMKAMSLPKSEMPILLIGVGSYKDYFKLAKSERVPYEEYTLFEK